MDFNKKSNLLTLCKVTLNCKQLHSFKSKKKLITSIDKMNQMGPKKFEWNPPPSIKSLNGSQTF